MFSLLMFSLFGCLGEKKPIDTAPVIEPFMKSVTIQTLALYDGLSDYESDCQKFLDKKYVVLDEPLEYIAGYAFVEHSDIHNIIEIEAIFTNGDSYQLTRDESYDHDTFEVDAEFLLFCATDINYDEQCLDVTNSGTYNGTIVEETLVCTNKHDIRWR